MQKERIKLPPRLETVAEWIPADERVADIGTDHGYLPIFAVQSGRCPSAIAADVRSGPLSSAARNIQEAGLEERITVRLSNGLDAFEPQELDCVVMAGMGGRLMAELLQRAGRQGKLTQCRTMILQPQSEIGEVRRMIHECGYALCRERMCKDRGKFYTVLLAQPGQEAYRSDEYIFGRKLFEARDSVFHELLSIETQKLRNVAGRLSVMEKRSARAEKRLEEISRIAAQGERMLEQWDAQ